MSNTLFDFLLNNKNKEAAEYLISNGKRKPYSPIYFFPDTESVIIEEPKNVLEEKEN